MLKKEKSFPSLSFNKLTDITEQTIKKLSFFGWEIKKQKKKENEAGWVIEVPSTLMLPGERFLLDLFMGAYHKILTVNISDNRVLLECKEVKRGYVIDLQKEKNKIIDDFFSHLNCMINSGELDKSKLKKYSLNKKIKLILIFIVAIIFLVAYFYLSKR